MRALWAGTALYARGVWFAEEAVFSGTRFAAPVNFVSDQSATGRSRSGVRRNTAVEE